MPNFDGINPNYAKDPNKHSFFAEPPKKNRRKWKRWLLLLIVLVLGIWTVSHFLIKTNQIFTKKNNIFARIGSLFLSPNKPLIGEEEGLVNILLMGIGGEGHDGAHLTDTMIIASINSKTNEVVLVSIPRDFALTLPTYGYNKINAAYAYAYKDDPSTAGEAAIAAAEKITGYKIPYFAVIDFKGFVKAIDDIGGVDVIIDRTFTDTTFPNDETKGYIPPVTFTQGSEHMNGERALIFARSRHSENSNEGSDFARSERQKKIIVAFKEKVVRLNLTQLSTINKLLSDFTNNFRTNLEPYELKRIADMAKGYNSDNIYSLSLEPDGVLICSALVDPQTGIRVPEPAPTPIPVPTPTIQKKTSTTNKTTTTKEPTPTETEEQPEIIRMYVIQPCEGKSFTDIQEFLVNAPDLARLKKEAAVIEIQTSLGRPISPTKFEKLADVGFDLRYELFKGKLPYDRTILYDNSNGTKPKTLDFLKANYSFETSDVGYPVSNADFVIILGKD